jgi:hypothetical protein
MSNTKENKPTTFEMCQNMSAKGMTEDEIITALSEHAKLPLLKAVQAYKSYLKESGQVLSKEERQEKINGIIVEHIKDGKIDINSAVKAVSESMELTKTSSRAHVKRYCLANEIAFPVRTVISKEDLEQYKSMVVAGCEANTPRVDVIKSLTAEFSIDEKTANTAYDRIHKAEGYVTNSKTDEILTFIFENKSEFTTAKQLVPALVKEFGMKENTASRYWQHLTFARKFESFKETAKG